MLTLVPPDDADVFHCELCPNTGLDNMHMHLDIWLCDECHQSILADAKACSHDWCITENANGETGVGCDKCGMWKPRASTPL